MRGFLKVSKTEFKKHFDEKCYYDVIIPKRSTKSSAGYDFHLVEDLEIKPKERIVVASGIKAYMKSDEVLLVVIRSSLGIKHGIRLTNQLGVIDSDYFDNEDNEGHILMGLENTSEKVLSLKKGDRVVQGIFTKYLVADNEPEPSDKRVGGVGSTS